MSEPLTSAIDVYSSTYEQERKQCKHPCDDDDWDVRCLCKIIAMEAANAEFRKQLE